jgi:spore cortex formation protein SpoVR/YcgB (stage V sporulation)
MEEKRNIKTKHTPGQGGGKIMDMISLAQTYLKSARPSMLKKQKVENVFDAMKTISNQISYNNRKKTKKKG